MDVFPKFIIETLDGEDCIIIAKATYHKQLAHNVKNVKGGGLWTLDKETETFILSGESFEFGRANIEDLKACVNNKKVFSNYTQNRNFTDNFKFKYRNIYGEITDL